MPRLWIEDGLGREATILPKYDDGQERPPVKIKYRPPLSNALLKFEAATAVPTAAAVDFLYAFLADHLTEWDVTNDKGEATKPTVENLTHVPPSYVYAIRNEICDSVEKTAVALKN